MTQSKRQRILDGMLETAGAEGYEQASVRAVLSRTALYRQAFYDNFASKEDCFLLAYDAGLARVEASVRGGAAGETSWRRQLRGGLAALLDFLDAEPDVGRALIVEVHPAGAAAQAKQTAALGRCRGFLDRGRTEAPAGAQAPQIAPEAIVAGILTVIHSNLSCGAAGRFRDLLGELSYFAVLPYFGVEVATEELRAA